MTTDLERRAEALSALSKRQLFFVGGAPRSGTTWLQTILDAHPEVSCRGEGLFQQQLASPLDAMVTARADAIAGKNERIFAHGPGYPLPTTDDADVLLGVGILLALERQCAGRPYKAVGEKTPENVFLFSRLKRIFPKARFIAIARDPRDVIASAWHFFPRPVPTDVDAAKTSFVGFALPSLAEGTRTMIEFGRSHVDDLLIVTYEALKATPVAVTKRLYDFLGVASDPAVVADCVSRTSFEAMTQGRRPGTMLDGSFFRAGVTGAWRQTLTPAMGAAILEQMGWAFDTFGWQA